MRYYQNSVELAATEGVQRGPSDWIDVTQDRINEFAKLASRPGEFHPQALLEPCLNLSVHTAPDVRPLTCSTRQCANRAGFARCIRANQSRAPFGRGRRRLYLFRAQRIR